MMKKLNIEHPEVSFKLEKSKNDDNDLDLIGISGLEDFPIPLDENWTFIFENSNFDKEFYIGIRPEDISLEKNSEITIDINIDLVENLGSEKIIYTYLNDTEIRIKSNKNIKDKNITIYLPKNKLYLFDNDKNRIRT